MFSIGRRVAALLLPRIEGSSHRRLVLPVTYLIIPLVLLILIAWPGGCASTTTPGRPLAAQPVIRVKLAKLAEKPDQAHLDQVQIAASQPPTYYTSTDPNRKVLNIHDDVEFPLTLSANGWKVGGTVIGTGELIIIPAGPKSFSVNGRKYRGEYHMVAVSGGKFDVVNHLPMEEYLRGVLRSELLADWQEETYKAQAIVARTYALYEKSINEKSGARHFDVFDGQQSQCYDGLVSESDKSDRAVAETAGVVVAYGPPGEEHIFKAYYSSCCGGVTQSVVHTFNEPFIEPLGDQDNHSQCSMSPRFNWGPIVIAKKELTRRFKLYGARRNRAEKDMALVSRVEVQQSNRFGRPVRFVVTDADGKRYSLTGEELRQATNTDAPEGNSSILLSSFVNVISDSDAIRFVDGHGWGHGVGMCQWCAEARARLGWRHEDIIQAAYPRSRLMGAY